MLWNLKAEMARYDIKDSDLGNVIKQSDADIYRHWMRSIQQRDLCRV